MARLLPFRRLQRPLKPRQPRLVELDDENADAVFAALSTETARDILGRLYEEPGTATDVAEAADTSLQNARYHLEKLQAAGLVEAVDTWYSSRGTEMTVYAPTSEPLVVAAGPDDQTSVLRSALARLVGALGVLGLASVFIDRLARWGATPGFTAGPSDDGDGDGDGSDAQLVSREEADTPAGGDAEAFDAATNVTATPMPTENATVVAEATSQPTSTPSPTPLLDAGGLDASAGLPPGALFFLGGLVVLAAVATWWYWRRYRPLYGTAAG